MATKLLGYLLLLAAVLLLLAVWYKNSTKSTLFLQLHYFIKIYKSNECTCKLIQDVHLVRNKSPKEETDTDYSLKLNMQIVKLDK